MSSDWLLLHYKLPTDPSALRVYIWRKLKRLGAVLLLDTIWVLPNTPRTLEQFQWLAAEISEMGGEAYFWLGQPALSGQDDELHRQFLAQVNDRYATLLEQLQQPAPDLDQISHQYQQTRSRDYFDSELGEQVKEKLLALRGENS
jgi:hypothetical protein